jgi:hypothetical protein
LVRLNVASAASTLHNLRMGNLLLRCLRNVPTIPLGKQAKRRFPRLSPGECTELFSVMAGHGSLLAQTT